MFLYLGNGLRKDPKIPVEKNFRSFFLFTIKNVAFGYTLCQLENVPLVCLL